MADTGTKQSASLLEKRAKDRMRQKNKAIVLDQEDMLSDENLSFDSDDS